MCSVQKVAVESRREAERGGAKWVSYSVCVWYNSSSCTLGSGVCETVSPKLLGSITPGLPPRQATKGFFSARALPPIIWPGHHCSGEIWTVEIPVWYECLIESVSKWEFQWMASLSPLAPLTTFFATSWRCWRTIASGMPLSTQVK